QAVQDAVAMAVQEAVSVVLTKTLTNSAVVAKLQAAAPVAQAAQPEPAPTLRQRMAACVSWFTSRCRHGMSMLRQLAAAVTNRIVRTGATLVFQAQAKVVATAWRCRWLWRIRNQIALALAAGLLLAVAGYFACPLVSAATSGLCGVAGILGLQAM